MPLFNGGFLTKKLLRKALNRGAIIFKKFTDEQIKLIKDELYVISASIFRRLETLEKYDLNIKYCKKRITPSVQETMILVLKNILIEIMILDTN